MAIEGTTPSYFTSASNVSSDITLAHIFVAPTTTSAPTPTPIVGAPFTITPSITSSNTFCISNTYVSHVDMTPSLVIIMKKTRELPISLHLDKELEPLKGLKLMLITNPSTYFILHKLVYLY